MATLVWDKIGDRVYQVGVDRAVLYLLDGTVVPWNGLISVEDGSTFDLQSFYLDGIKYLDTLTPGDFSGKLSAFTYPAEFERVIGILSPSPGLSYYEQPPMSFNLSYRTRVGNDLDGPDHGYKIHLLYNLVANPDSYTFETLGEKNDPIAFSWKLTGTPPKSSRFRPTVHLSIDSRDTKSDTFELLENVLYGTAFSNPHFPSITEIASFFGILDELLIIDNGDGTWTAVDSSDQYITMLDSTTFQIDNADVTYLDIATYEISTTNP